MVADAPERRQSGRPLVLDGVSLTTDRISESGAGAMTHCFAPGLLHIVGGTSQTGKSALLSVLSLAVPPAQGALWWGEFNLSTLEPSRQASWRRDKVGLVRQKNRLVAVMSVREHIRLAAAARGQRDAGASGLAMLDALGLGARLDCRPGELSASEKQRVVIAQALCARPAILLADEPTAALGQDSAALVAATLRDFARTNDAVVICTSRDLMMLNAADELLMLE